MVPAKWLMQTLVMLDVVSEKITLYRGKEVVKKKVASEVAVDELINLLKESDAWVEVPVIAW